MKKLFVGVVTVSMTLLPALALADDKQQQVNRGIQYNGDMQVERLSDLVSEAPNHIERDVIVEGILVRRISDERFVFSDGKDQIEVELDDDIHLDQPIDNKTKVRLFGEYENEHQPEIEVDHIQII
ncbi:YgiW/YdeI family stress tolerance OB fold protein [Vibrio olivae]|uniref:YgiW/YdeI family stress tolerance OB fold protein n=1 Tax=Vibrio olivae TaxID=1243002 RepID=A0ABV5HTE9_9VIBR